MGDQFERERNRKTEIARKNHGCFPPELSLSGAPYSSEKGAEKTRKREKDTEEL